MKNNIPDIYFDSQYGSLYEKVENGSREIFTYESSEGKIYSQFIKRVIPDEINGKQLFDIITPYGYGGPIILQCVGNKEKLLKSFEKEFSKYCQDNCIVSEFVRFHPLINNAEDFREIYDIVWDRNTVGTNLGEYEDPVSAEFSKSCRKRIRKALRDGISCRVIECPDSLNGFKEIYYSTMNRNQARDYYYFTDEYFNDCLKYYREHILLVEAVYEEKVVAAGFYFTWKDTIHIHLSGTLNEYLYLSPAYILRYEITLWGKEHGYRMIHHGGGRTNSPEDSLFTFKKQFGQNTLFNFYVGKKIWNEETYDVLCKKKNNLSAKDNFFPQYRED